MKIEYNIFLKKCIILLLINHFFKYINSIQILKLNFERNFSEILTKEKLMSNLYNNDIYTYITIGSNLEKIPISFKMNSFPFYIITSKTNQSKNPFYHYEKSSSFINESIKLNFTEQDFLIAYHALETISLNKEKNFQNLQKFQLMTPLQLNKENIINEAGSIGLNIFNLHSNLDNTDFILQLKKRKIIDSFPFTFKYINSKKEKGEFILGALPDEYDKYYNSSKYKFSLTKIYAEKPIWALDFDKIIYFKQLNTFSNLFFFRIEIGLIVSPNSYKKFFKDSFFNQTKCYEEIFKSEDLNEFYYFYCDSSVDISKFGYLIFYNHIFNMNFTLNEKDLFYYFEKRNYFLIVFSVKYNYDWILGSPFLKKYQMIFDKDKKIISTYEPNDSFEFSFIFVIIFLLLVIIFFLSIYISFYLIKKKRKLRVNEIEDNYEYLPQ